MLRLGRAEFEDLSAKSPSIWHTLTETLARRVAQANVSRAPPPDPRPRTLALVRAGGALSPVFVEAFAEVFRRAHRMILLRSAMAEEVLGGARLDSAEATRALNALESKHDYVVFVAENELTPWSEKAIGQADLVLAVGWHNSCDASPNALERLAAQLLPPDARRLVLLHETRARISDTRRWLARRPIVMHHHVALDDPGDYARLYRFVNGTALGLIACGSGAYCGPTSASTRRCCCRASPSTSGWHLGRRSDDRGLRHGSFARRRRPRHAQHIRHQQGHAPLYVAALQPARSRPLRQAARHAKLKRFKVDYRSLPGRAALLKAMVNPFLRRALPPAPGVGTVLMRSLMANRRDFERRLRPEDLLLVPPFPPDMGMLDWHRHTELMDASYRWAMREIARLRAEGHAALGGGGRISGGGAIAGAQGRPGCIG